MSLFYDFNTMAPPDTRFDEGPARAPGVPDLRRLYLKPSSTTTSRCALGVAAPRGAGADGAAWRGRGTRVERARASDGSRFLKCASETRGLDEGGIPGWTSGRRVSAFARTCAR